MRNGINIFSVYSCFINQSAFNKLTTLGIFERYLWKLSSPQCRVRYCSVMSNKAVQIDLLHQQTEIQR